METLLLILCGFGLLLFLLLTYFLAYSFYYQVLLGPVLQRDLGFREGARYFSVQGRLCSAVAIEAIVPGGIMACAGFRAGDLFPGLSHTSIFKLLHRHRGREVELKVVDGGDGPYLEERPSRVLKVTVPLQKKHRNPSL